MSEKRDINFYNQKPPSIEKYIEKLKETPIKADDGWIVEVYKILLRRDKDNIYPYLIVLKLIEKPEEKRQMEIWPKEIKKRRWTIRIIPDFKNKRLLLKQIDFYQEEKHLVTRYDNGRVVGFLFNPEITHDKEKEILEDARIPEPIFDKIQNISYTIFHDLGGRFPSLHPNQLDLFKDQPPTIS